jgi:hypothetical protein
VALLPGTPGNDDGGASIAAYYGEHGTRAIVAAFVIGLTAPLFVSFAALLAGARRPAGETRTAADILLVGGGILTAGTFLLTAAVQFALADVPDKLAGGALQALNVLSNDLWTAWNPALGVMMLGAAGTLARRGGALTVLGRVAAVLGVALFIPFADFFALLATGLWLIAASAVLFRDAGERAAVAHARPAPAS